MDMQFYWLRGRYIEQKTITYTLETHQTQPGRLPNKT